MTTKKKKTVRKPKTTRGITEQEIMDEIARDEKRRQIIGGVITLIIIAFAIIPHFSSKVSFSSKSKQVKIVEQYDCSDKWGQHRLCGIVQNNGNTEYNVSLKVRYYDSNNIKIDEKFAYITIEAKGKAKFQTFGFDKHFKTYKLEIDSIY